MNKIVFIGFGKMGLVHARIFDKLNFEIVGVLTSNNNSGVIAKKKTKRNFWNKHK